MKNKILPVIVLVLIGAIAAAGILQPYLSAGSEMPEDGVLTIRQVDGNLLLSWPAADRADGYLVEILQSLETGEQHVIFSAVSEDAAGIRLPELPGTELLIRVSSVVEYSVFGAEKTRCGANALEITAQLDMPEITRLDWIPDPGSGTADVRVRTNGAECWCAYLLGVNGERELLHVGTEEQWILRFGDGGQLPVPEEDQTHRIGFAACSEVPGLKLQGAVTAHMTVDRQDLLGRDLNVAFSGSGDNRVALSWDETKGEYYEVQRMDGNGQWESVCRIGREEARYYVSEALPKFRSYAYRVVAAGGQIMADSGYAAVSETVSFMIRESPICATVWPVRNLEAYSDTKRNTVTAAVKAGKAYCVLDERDDMFGIRVEDRICYIDSNYCMINLPEYMGDLCSYQISNSTGALYTVHEFEIPGVTGAVTPGYEYVHQADGSYLVPLLYPTAKKLVTAAKDAISRGYRLKIYDSFRPQLATKQIYRRTASVLDREIPSRTYTGVKRSALQLPEPDENGSLTYRNVMTGNTYALNSFLAKGTSRHNLGVALDLTLESLDTGKELRMQTSMHDLSRYSVTGRNHTNAETLAAIMKEAGFAPLSTEWWHFQDDDAKNSLDLAAVHDGISAEGWACDDTGLRYRDEMGICYRDRTVRIGEKEYHFDEQGYLTGAGVSFG